MKKRKNRQKFLSGIIIFFTLIIIGCVLYIIWQQKPETTYDKYLIEAREKINQYNIVDQINSNPYSQTLEKMLVSDKYKSEYIKDYFLIVYREDVDFLDHVNKLLVLGYDQETINNLGANYDYDTIKFIVNQDDKIDLNYFEIANFIFANYSRYENYLINNSLELGTIVTYVNIGLDYEFYSQYELITVPDNVNVLVNKYHQLSKDFIPNDLVRLYNGKYIKAVAKEPLMDLINAAKEQGIHLEPRSVYRSFAYQTENYNNYVRRDGKTKADTFSARAGFSEHQTGLTADLADASGVFITSSSEEYNWLKDNASKYGFIIRYQLGKETITGYKFEPWHIRYIGVKHAQKLHELNITYDEYYDLFIRED